ncbi:hypothetical protein [Longispora fulva]|uniref:Uncharacterized protein n=1 Tax=Longispora fulva TaxID=619741 RepID=A0A8J7KNH3_9ACTN|nr:hypothetical protein [Longispora fulva]MBG6141589.1 hypothetical protein [Longispora fulva]
MGFYTSLGGGRSRGGARRPSVASYQRQAAQAQRAQQQAAKAMLAQQLAASFAGLVNVHRSGFASAQRPIAPAPPEPNRAAMYKQFEQQFLAGIGWLKRTERKAAKQRAASATEQGVQVERARLAAEQARWQQQLDERWKLLCDNDPEVVMETLAEAFDDNEAPAAAVGVQGDEIALVILVPADDIVPEQMPSTTQAGNLTFKKVSKTTRASFYLEFVCGSLIVTLREAFAVAPAIRQARVVVLRNMGIDAYGRKKLDCVMAGRYSRQALDGVRWDTASAIGVATETSTDLLVKLRGQAREMQPIDLTSEPEIASLIRAVDVTELTA